MADNLAGALLEVQSANVRVKKDAKNPHFGNAYATLGAVIDALKPHLTHAEIVVLQEPTFLPSVNGAEPALLTRVTHAPTGEATENVSPLILDRDNMQGYGSALTYARRYALVSLFTLDADDDDDANAAAAPAKPKETIDDVKDKVFAKAEELGFVPPDDPANLRVALADFMGIPEDGLDKISRLRKWLREN